MRAGAVHPTLRPRAEARQTGQMDEHGNPNGQTSTDARPRVALVLGAAVRPDGTASPTLDLRARHAVGLHRAGRVDAICLTGGPGAHGPAEAQVAANIAREMGLPDDALVIEATSTNTVQNIALALPLLPGGADLVLVSNRWHLPRAWLIARLLGCRPTLSGPPGTAGTARTAAAILREIAAAPLSAWRALRWARRSGR